MAHFDQAYFAQMAFDQRTHFDQAHFDWENYQVQTCPFWRDSTCPFGNKCFDSHANPPLRRKVVVRRHGKWNYSSRYCLSETENTACTMGDNCCFSHRELERNYHPHVYKTKMCTRIHESSFHYVTCTFAHDVKELREVSMPKLRLNPQMSVFTMIQSYKVLPCPNLGNCQCDDFYYHNPKEQRRVPMMNDQLVYLHHPCPNVKKMGFWGDPFNDSQCQPLNQKLEGVPWNCRFSHTLTEQMYHPFIFRTLMCHRKKCSFGSFCSHAHNRKDMRLPGGKLTDPAPLHNVHASKRSQ